MSISNTPDSDSPLTPPFEDGKRKIDKVDGIFERLPEKSSHGDKAHFAGSTYGSSPTSTPESPDAHKEGDSTSSSSTDPSLISSGSERRNSNAEASSKRRAQNRAAQRAFRERREKYVKGLEEKIQSLESAITVSTSAQRTKALSEENESLRDLISQLSQENDRLKQSSKSQFSFEMPLIGQGLDGTDLEWGSLPSNSSPTTTATCSRAHGHTTPPRVEGEGSGVSALPQTTAPASSSTALPSPSDAFMANLGSLVSWVDPAEEAMNWDALLRASLSPTTSSSTIPPAHGNTPLSMAPTPTDTTHSTTPSSSSSSSLPTPGLNSTLSTTGIPATDASSQQLHFPALNGTEFTGPRDLQLDPLFSQYREDTNDALLADSLVDISQLPMLSADPLEGLDDAGLGLPSLFADLGPDYPLGASSAALSLPSATATTVGGNFAAFDHQHTNHDGFFPTPLSQKSPISPISSATTPPSSSSSSSSSAIPTTISPTASSSSPLHHHQAEAGDETGRLERLMGVQEGEHDIPEHLRTKDGIVHPLLNVVPQLGVLKSKDLDELCSQMKKKCKAAESTLNSVPDIHNMSALERKQLDERMVECFKAAQRTVSGKSL